MKIPIKSINIEKSPQPRGKTHPEKAAEYAERIAAGDIFPPIVVFNTPEHGRVIADGMHTHAGHVKHGSTDIDSDLRDGSYADACDFALRSNLEHGFQRSAEDKRGYAVSCLHHHPDWSNNRIAEWIKVSPYLVGEVEQELKNEGNFKRPDKTFGMDKKPRSAPAAKPVSKPPPPPEDDDEPERPEVHSASADEMAKFYKTANPAQQLGAAPRRGPAAEAAAVKQEPLGKVADAVPKDASEFTKAAAMLDASFHPKLKLNPTLIKAMLKDPERGAEIARLVIVLDWPVKRAAEHLKGDVTSKSTVGDLQNRCIAAGGRFQCEVNTYQITITKL